MSRIVWNQDVSTQCLNPHKHGTYPHCFYLFLYRYTSHISILPFRALYLDFPWKPPP
jgi:hypothetical protein